MNEDDDGVGLLSRQQGNRRWVTIAGVVALFVAAIGATAIITTDKAKGNARRTSTGSVHKPVGDVSSQVRVQHHLRAPGTSLSTAASSPLANSTGSIPIHVYLGNGCFWERQYAYTQLELKHHSFRRSLSNVTSKVGYAGGTGDAPGGLVCYHHPGSQANVYSHLGHAEVVSVTLDGSADQIETQFRVLLKDYFNSFLPTFDRPDPMDRGAEYRNVIGIPGGINGNLFRIISESNFRGMKLASGKGDENDTRGQVHIMDSKAFPFFRGEQYHQFHSNFFGESYPSSYSHDLWHMQINAGKIPPTGCPSGHHW